MRLDMQQQLPKKVEMLELLLRDGFQHAPKVIPTETKLWFADQFIRAGYKVIEVTNFSHPKFLPQTRDAEDLLKRVYYSIACVGGGRVSGNPVRGCFSLGPYCGRQPWLRTWPCRTGR